MFQIFHRSLNFFVPSVLFSPNIMVSEDPRAPHVLFFLGRIPYHLAHTYQQGTLYPASNLVSRPDLPHLTNLVVPSPGPPQKVLLSSSIVLSYYIIGFEFFKNARIISFIFVSLVLAQYPAKSGFSRDDSLVELSQ